jgi:hypothetical protein
MGMRSRIDGLTLLGVGVTTGDVYLLVVFGGSGIFDDDDLGIGVDDGVEPSSQRPPMHVMMNVWRGTRAWWFAGAWSC